MDVNLKVTDTPQETSFYDLVSGDNVLTIPMFQRPYRWSKKNLEWLLDDIAEIQSDVSKSCFLGVIVCVSRGASPGRPMQWEIVDGQQRLSTLYLILLACVEVAARSGDLKYASGVVGTYLMVRPMSDNPFNTKLIPAMADRGQFKKIWDEIVEIPGLRDELKKENNLPRPPIPSAQIDGPMVKQYKEVRKKIKDSFSSGGIDWLKGFVQAVSTKLSVVSITLRDPLVAPKIFERLNNRAELVTVADLVRNEVFALAAPQPDGIEYIFTNLWEPFSNSFSKVENGLEKFLFPYGLMLNKQVTKAELFSTLRGFWRSFASPDLIINDMNKYVSSFLFLEAGIVDEGLSSDELKESIMKFFEVGHPSSTFSFLIKLLSGVKDDLISSEEAAKIFQIVESFLFRRAVCGIEPTGLHAGFKVLWSDLTEGDEDNFQLITAERFRSSLSKKPTIFWPTNQQFTDAIRNNELYTKKVCQYALKEYELANIGESPSDLFHIEHICPQTKTADWEKVFADDYKKIINTWANLIPLTQRMNSQAGQGSFNNKCVEYSTSIFATTRAIARDYKSWTPSDLNRRSQQIVDWALKRWPWEAL
jgi:hypothetical protein